MGQHIKDLLEERKTLVKEMLKRLNNWDESAEDATEILEKNDKLIKDLKNIEKELGGIGPKDPSYQANIEEIIGKNKELLEKIENDKQVILDSLKQTAKSDKALKSYVTSFDRSIFINKNI